MEDVCHVLKCFGEGTWADEVGDHDEVEAGCVFCEEIAECGDLGFSADAETQLVACCEGLGDDVGAYEAGCAGDEDERLGHGGREYLILVEEMGGKLVAMVC